MEQTKTAFYKKNEFFILKSKEGYYYKINLNEIIWLEIQDMEAVFHMKKNNSFAVYGNLSFFENFFNEEPFFCCCQKYIINMNHVYYGKNCFITKYGNEIFITKKELKRIKSRYNSFVSK